MLNRYEGKDKVLLEQRLIEILEEETTLYEEIRTLKDLEREALLAFATEDLEATTQTEQTLVTRAEILEDERREIVYQIGSIQGVGNPGLSLREVAPLLTTQSRAKAASLARKLSSICVEIGRAQYTNAGLFSRSVRYLQELMEGLLRKAHGRPVAYDPVGRFSLAKEAAPGLLDRTV